MGQPSREVPSCLGLKVTPRSPVISCNQVSPAPPPASQGISGWSRPQALSQQRKVAALGTMGKAVSGARVGAGVGSWRQGLQRDLMPSLFPHPQENYEMYSVELGSGSGGNMAAKMSKKKAGGGGGKRKEKLENMKKEMEIVSMRLGLGWGLGGAEHPAGMGPCESRTASVLSPPHRTITSCQWRSWNRNTRPV